MEFQANHQDTLKSGSPGEIYYYHQRNYSPEELIQIFHWANEPYPAWVCGGGRDGTLVIEDPPAKVCSKDVWRALLDMAVLPEWRELHPTLRRTDIRVRFVSKLYDPVEKIKVGGNINWILYKQKKVYVLRIALSDNEGRLHNEGNLLFKIIHELAEEDFWLKTSPGERPALAKEDSPPLDILTSEDYSKLLDEEIANRRALRALRRIWPEVRALGSSGHPVDNET